MRTIRHISIGSAIKVTAIISGLVAVVLGFFFIFLPFLFGGAFFGGAVGDTGGLGFGLGFVGGLITWIITIIVSLIYGAILGLLSAFFYNITAGWVGGLEIDLGE